MGGVCVPFFEALLIDRQPGALRVDELGTNFHVLGDIGCHSGCTEMQVCRGSSDAQGGGDPPKMVKMDPSIDDIQCVLGIKSCPFLKKTDFLPGASGAADPPEGA